MDDLIGTVKIDAKHSNEDAIAPFPVWVEKYGDRIGNFGGIDTDAVCRLSRVEMKEYITDVIRPVSGAWRFCLRQRQFDSGLCAGGGLSEHGGNRSGAPR